MDSDAQDILGQPTLPAMEGFDRTPSSFSPLSTLFTLLVLLGLCATALSLRRMFLENREKSLKLATRRRLGIPDNDRRPFNVAYAAAVLAKEDREKNERSKPRRQVPERPPPSSSLQHHPQAHPDQHLRNRSDRYRSATLPFPGAYTSYSSLGSTYTPPQEQPPPHTNAQPGGSTRHAARRIVDLSSEVEPRKRGYYDSDADLDGDARKARRVGGGVDVDDVDEEGEDDDDELMDDGSDVPEEAEWEDYETALSHQRPQKRGLGDGGETGRDKRARKVSLVPEDMEVDGDEEQDELRDLHSPVRGKKRDRAEAGSTFGGDDDESAVEGEGVRRSRRKRRTVGRRREDGGVGSRKRDREMDVDEDIENVSGEVSVRRYKKGKRHSRVNGDKDDVSVNDSLTSSASKSRRGRKVGEEWESNGVRYKLGPDGERLQQALVKRARNKFVMPKDSEHPDKDENLEVFVETWLTDSEYTKAKDQKLLAWQDTPKKPEPEMNLSVKIPATLSKPPAPVGKNLLWTTATSTPAGSPASISPLDSPSLRGSGLRTPGGRGRYSLGMNPFEKQPDISTKRIVSASIMNGSLSAPAPTVTSSKPGSLTDSTNVQQLVAARPRTLSKWERQELEAEAIMRLRYARQAELDAQARERAEGERREKEVRERVEREKVEREKQERERLERERLERERLEREKREKEVAAAKAQAAASAAPPVVPRITVTTPSAEGIKPAGGFSFAPPAAAAPPPAAPQAEKKNVGAALATTFFGPSSASSSTPTSTTSSTAPSSLFGPAKTEGGGGGFSFAKPAAAAPAPAAGAFSFGEKKPEAKSASAFSFPTSTTTGGAASAFGAPAGGSGASAFGVPATSAATTMPKFDFMGGGASKPAGDTAANEAKPAASGGFSFGNPSTAAATTGSTATTTTPAAPAPGGIKFSFSGNTSIPSSSTQNANGAVSSAFGITPASTANGTGSVFGATNKPSLFGQPSASGAAGGSSALGGALGSGANAGTTGNAFSFGGDKGKAPASGFGTFVAPSALASATSTGGGAAGSSAFGGGSSGKTESVFGVKPATDAASAAGAGKPTFSFGGASAGTTTPKGPFSGFSSAGVNGAAGAGTTTPAGGPVASGSGGGFGFNFGGAAAGAGGAKPATAPAPAAGGAFSFGAPSAAGGTFGTTTTPAGTPGFLFGKK